MKSLKEIGNTLLKSDSLIITFLRSVVSSQCASWVDYIICFSLFALADFNSFWSTACGAFCGGVVNCIINYKFTFRADGVDWRAVMVKYSVVWVGSLLLNSYGTEAVFNIVSGWEWLLASGFTANGIFIATRLLVSLIVSWFWNFVLQRYVVYRPMPFDKYIISALGGKQVAW